MYFKWLNYPYFLHKCTNYLWINVYYIPLPWTVIQNAYNAKHFMFEYIAQHCRWYQDLNWRVKSNLAEPVGHLSRHAPIRAAAVPVGTPCCSGLVGDGGMGWGSGLCMQMSKIGQIAFVAACGWLACPWQRSMQWLHSTTRGAKTQI